MSEPDRFEMARLEKLQAIEALGVDPWGQRFDGHRPIGEARDKCPAEQGLPGQAQQGPEIRVAGRIMLRNNKGKLKFFHLQDWTGRIQLMCSKADFSEEQWKLIELLDLGDLIGVDGKLKVSNTGEKTIGVTHVTFLTKSLAQPPEKFHGAKDIELLLRQRYIDLIYNEGVLGRMLLKRGKIIDSIRRTLRERGFVEAETPVLHAIAGGAAARPFLTHHNTLDMPLFLRIALELHLKRLMVGGVERVYEIGRVFRNEGVDTTHNPEFTMIELYQAYGDYETMMELTEALFINAITVLDGKAQRPWGDKTVDYSPPWQRRKYADLFREYAGCDLHDAAAVAEVAKKHHIPTAGKHPDVIVNDVFEETVERHLAGPVFVIDLSRRRCAPHQARSRASGRDRRTVRTVHRRTGAGQCVYRAQRPAIAGRAVPHAIGRDVGRRQHGQDGPRFRAGLESGHVALAGSLGIGIDRLVMILTNSHSIRDVIYFLAAAPRETGRVQCAEN